MTSLTLPYPPTTNNLFFNAGKRRVRTKRYDLWIAEATVWVLQQRPAKTVGAFDLLIIATRPDRRARDISNLIKPIEDLLVKCGIVEDDSRAMQVAAGWSKSEPLKGGAIQVTVTPA